MALATGPGGALINLKDCYIAIPNSGQIELNNLPEISDSKSAAYVDDVVMGRAFPLKSYSHSENRSISMTLHFVTINSGDPQVNLQYLRDIESLTYPRDGDGTLPFYPPPVCRIKCGKLLGDSELCVILKSYSVKFPTDVPWDDTTYIPYKFDVDTQWDVVYRTVDLPGQARIMNMGQ